MQRHRDVCASAACRVKEASPVDGALPPPRGLTVSHVEVGDTEYAILSFPAPAWDLPECFTAAEREVVRGVLRGDSNLVIARTRATSVHTVANQIAAVFGKMKVSSRIELARRLVDQAVARSTTSICTVEP